MMSWLDVQGHRDSPALRDNLEIPDNPGFLAQSRLFELSTARDIYNQLRVHM